MAAQFRWKSTEGVECCWFSATSTAAPAINSPELVRLHRDNGMALVMVGRGEVEENRRKVEAHGIKFPVVLQERWKLSKQYRIFATPVGFLINEEGVIAK